MKVIFIILLTLLVYGCAAKKLAVDNADTLMSYQVNKRLPLYSAQKEQLDKEVDQFLNNSKPLAQEILPIVEGLNIKNPEKIEEQYKAIEAKFKKISNNFSSLMSKYMAKLDPKQQKDFFAILDDENRAIIKKDKDEHIDDIEERFEIFLGSVNGKQKEIIKDYSDYFHGRSLKRFDRRVKLHQEFKTIYSQDVSAETKEKAFQESFAAYQEQTFSESRNLEIIKKTIPTIDVKQKKHFREEVKEVRDIIKYYLSVDY